MEVMLIFSASCCTTRVCLCEFHLSRTHDVVLIQSFNFQKIF